MRLSKTLILSVVGASWLMLGSAIAQTEESADAVERRDLPAQNVDGKSQSDDMLGWGLVFTLDGLGDFNIGTVDGLGIAGTYDMGDNHWVRGGVVLSYTPTEPVITRTAVETGPEEIVSFSQSNPSNTGVTRFQVQADYLTRMSDKKIAPYWGIGAEYDLDIDRRVTLDDVTRDDLETEVDKMDTQHTLSARGILGADWRLNKHVSVFAEFGVSLAILTQDNNRTSTRTTTKIVNADGSTTNDTTSVTTTSSRTGTWLNLATGVQQSGNLGVSVKF